MKTTGGKETHPATDSIYDTLHRLHIMRPSETDNIISVPSMTF